MYIRKSYLSSWSFGTPLPKTNRHHEIKVIAYHRMRQSAFPLSVGKGTAEK